MKRLLFLLMALCSMCLSASAYVTAVIDGICYDISETTVTVTQGGNYSGDIVIPESITYNNSIYSVTSIGDKAFSGCSGLTSVTIPNSVTSIGEWAFAYSTGLTSVTIPNSVTSIGNSAFSGCSSLTHPIIVNDMFVFLPTGYEGHYSIPENISTIIGGAFADCSSLTSVTIPNSVTSIGDLAFEYCSSLTSVTIPNSVTSIGNSAFYGCSSLTHPIIVNDMFVFLPTGYEGHYSIPENISKIIGGAFEECSGLTSVTIPNSVTSIGDFAFSGCSSLTHPIIVNDMFVFLPTGYEGHYSIPENISKIIGGAFEECSGLTSVTIPNSVTSIGGSTFFLCSSLTSVTIPNSVTSIGSLAFYECSSLTSVTIPNSVTSIGSAAFVNCKNIENVYCNAEEVPWIGPDAFYASNIEYATLHVPASAIETYKTTEPWSGFGTIKALEGAGGETKKCETPTISFVDGKLTFSCETEGVEYVSEVTCSDVNKYYSNEINLAACYDITVTAKKTGFVNSDIATAKLYWLTSSGSLEGDGINNVSMRGIAIQSADGFINISGLDNNETVSFYALDGKALGTAKSIDGNVLFSAKQGTIVVARIGKESVKIAVK